MLHGKCKATAKWTAGRFMSVWRRCVNKKSWLGLMTENLVRYPLTRVEGPKTLDEDEIHYLVVKQREEAALKKFMMDRERREVDEYKVA